MTTKAWIRIAGVLVALAVVAVALVAVPLASWTTPAILSLLLLAFAAGFAFWAPALYPPAPGSDATRIALIGPLFVQALALIALSAFSLSEARSHGANAAVWTLDVLYVAVLLIGTVLLKASVPVIEGAAARSQSITSARKPTDERW
jgi:hypothetical protein